MIFGKCNQKDVAEHLVVELLIIVTVIAIIITWIRFKFF